LILRPVDLPVPEFGCRLRACHLESLPPLGDDAATVPGDTVAEPLVWCPVARHIQKPELTKMADIQEWMKELNPDRKLVELCLPGSHDAGVYWDTRTPFWGRPHEVNPNSETRCQGGPIWDQATNGSRVFDIRVFLRREFDPGNKSEVPSRETPTMGHFFKETIHGHVGGYGGTLLTALHDATHFLKAYPSEFIIFRIGHTKCTKEVAEVLKGFQTGAKHKDESDDYAKHRRGVVYTGAKGNLAHLEYQHLKGKLLLVFDKKFRTRAAEQARADGSRDPFGPRNMGAYGYYPYEKYPEMPAIGLSFCGEYSGSVWDKARNEGNWTSGSADLLGHKGCDDHRNHKERANHLLWVYWQQTGGNIWEKTTTNTKEHQGMHARLGNFLNDVSTKSQQFAMPNVIGHDFVTKETCAKIVKLNPDLKNTSFD
jgi:hypothetical protein